LPGLTVAHDSAPADVRVDLVGDGADELSTATDWVERPPEEADDQAVRSWTLQRCERTYWRLRYAIDDGYAEFVLDHTGTAIRATSTAGVIFEDVASFLLGPVLGRALRLRGTPCLHASAVAVGDQALAIVGSKAAGKSTTAAGLAVRGCAVLSDDIAVLGDDGGTYSVQPGYRRLRLWNPAIQAFYGSRDTLPRVLSNRGKRYLDLEPDGCESRWRFHPAPLPLAAIYVLGPRRGAAAAPFIRALTPAQALIALTANRYAAHMLSRESRAREFHFLAQVSRHVPIRQVERPDDMGAVHQVCAAILEDFDRLGDGSR
jgi:hypothetical protein